MICGAWVCPAHRWGTGSESNGYYCVDSWCAPVHKGIFSIPPWARADLGKEASPVPVAKAISGSPSEYRFSTLLGLILATVVFILTLFLAHVGGWL
jgi:hypothetical protein